MAKIEAEAIKLWAELIEKLESNDGPYMYETWAEERRCFFCDKSNEKHEKYCIYQRAKILLKKAEVKIKK